MRLRRMMIGGLVAATTVVLAAVPVAAEAPTAASPPQGDPPARTATLPTGDRITVRESEAGLRLTAQPGPAGTALLTRRVGGRFEVLPVAALPGLAAGRLDRSQFDLTALVAGGGEPPPASTVDTQVESYDLTLVHTGGNGRPAIWYDTIVLDLASGESYVASSEDGTGDGTARLHLPRGRYVVAALIVDGDPLDPLAPISTLVHPELELTAAQTLAVDARQASPVSVTLPHGSARAFNADVTYVVRRAGASRPEGFSLFLDDFSRVRVGRLGPDTQAAEIGMRVQGSWAEPGPAGSFEDSPYSYNLAWYRIGGVFDRAEWTVEPGDLASVRMRYLPQVPGSLGFAASEDIGPLGPTAAFTVPLPVSLPFTQTAYFSVADGARWVSTFDERVTTDTGEEIGLILGTDAIGYAAGRSYEEVWNAPVYGPVLVGSSVANHPSLFRQNTERFGDEIVVNTSLLGDLAGHGMFDTAATGRTVLSRDGVVIGKEPRPGSGFYAVPRDTGDYRLETDLRRRLPGGLSTQVSLVWTFRSGPVAPNKVVPLPVSVVRYAPALDQSGVAPAGARFQVPVSVQRLPGSPAGQARSLTVEVSYDDGQQWRAVPVQEDGGRRWVTLEHPDGSGYVSLRASAEDTTGSTVTQTIIRAYRIEP
jgi:hypothetical protein